MSEEHILKFPGLSSTGEPITPKEPPPEDFGEIGIEVYPVSPTDRRAGAVVVKFSKSISFLTLELDQAVELSGFIAKAVKAARG